MDIHRCRFVPYQPQAINALAFSHSSNTKQHTPKDLKLAIGRANGDLELWNPNRGSWVQERIFRGSIGRTVEQVQWTQDLVAAEEDSDRPKRQTGPLRLFSSGGSTSITEWDVEKGVPKAHADANADDVWCFAPQPQWTEAQGQRDAELVRGAPSQLLAAGCSDGSIVLFSTADNELRFDRVLMRPHSKKSRCISITWRDRNVVVAGFEESTIRVLDVRNRQTIRQMALPKSRDAAKPLVWCVSCLPNGTILSGDSSGELKVWDSQNYSLVQRLKTHNADVLDITTNAAGTMILTCGVDRRTVAYAPQAGTGSARTQRWHEIRHRRFHEHDVKALVSYESRTLNIAVSGGMDTVPVVVPLKDWDEDYHRSLSHLPQKAQMSASASARLLLTWWNRELLVWYLPHRYREGGLDDSMAEDQAGQKLLARIQLKDDGFITSAHISNSGTMIAAATTTSVKLFQIRKTIAASGQTEIRSRPVNIPMTLANTGASEVRFSPDSKWLCTVRLTNVVTMVKVMPATSSKDKRVVHDRIVKLDRKRGAPGTSRPSSLGDYAKIISTVAFSSDSRILAVGDLSGSIDTWVLEGHETDAPTIPQKLNDQGSDSSPEGSNDESDSDDETDSRVIQGQKWVRTPAGSQLPSLESAILALAFKPSTADPLSAPHVQGNEGLHATRHNHHPISSEHPPVEAGMLFAVTSNHQVVEFDALNCRLSDWSRRNPSSMLPESLRNIKDRVMGIWFDQRPTSDIDRLWLYGATFIYMLNLTKDFAVIGKEPQSVKVGRLGQHVLEVHPEHELIKAEADQAQRSHGKKRKRGTGAGDEMRKEQKYSTNVVVKQSNEDSDLDMGLLSPPQSVGDEDEENDEMDLDDGDDNLVARRRKVKGKPGEDNDGGQDEAVSQRASGPASWHTFQYRGVYGACALSTDATVQEAYQEESAPEVVIVERPMYDVELMPRFAGGQDW